MAHLSEVLKPQPLMIQVLKSLFCTVLLLHRTNGGPEDVSKQLGFLIWFFVISVLLMKKIKNFFVKCVGNLENQKFENLT